VVVAVLRLE